MKLLTYKDQNPDPFEYPLQLDSENPKAQVTLRCLLGASAIHLVVLDNEDKVQLHAEIRTADEGEDGLDIDFSYQENDIQVHCEDRQIFLLSKDSLEKINYNYKVNPIYFKNKGLLDIALVIDGTNHLLKSSNEKDKKKYPITWQQLSQKILAFTGLLAKQYSTRVGVIAFADQAPPQDIKSEALIPLYHLKPQKPQDFRFKPFNEQYLKTQMEQVESSSGCDYVDAVADALNACQMFNWRQKARRLVILVGDSPGHSVLKPINKGGDINIRQYIVEIEALKLHQKRIEIMTLFINPLDKVKEADDAQSRKGYKKVIEYTKEQYQSLASLEHYYFQDTDFNAAKAAKEILQINGLIGRNAMFGELIEN